MTAVALHTEPEVLWARVLERVVRTPAGCWEWTGATNSKGYGCIGSGRRSRTVLVHRLAVLVRDGHLDPALSVDHTCHNADSTCPGGITCRHRLCVNPEHLDPVPLKVNINRSGHGQETHCVQGHPLTGSNVILKLRGSRKPVRNCRTCRDERDIGRTR